MIVPLPANLRPWSVTAWHFTDVSQGPELAVLTRGQWRPDERPEPAVWFGVGQLDKRLAVGDYLVRDLASNFSALSAFTFGDRYDTVVPEHPATLLALAREVLAMEFEPAEDAVAWLRRLLRVRHSDDLCGACRHPRFSHRGLHGKYGPCALCDRPGSDCVDYIEN